MKPNPYTAPRSLEGQRDPSPLPPVAVAGVTLAGILGVVYLFVAASLLYEIICASPQLKIDAYVREGTLSAIFLIVCGMTIRQFLARRRRAPVWLMVSPTLLVIFVFPGTYAVLTFFKDTIGW